MLQMEENTTSQARPSPPIPVRVSPLKKPIPLPRFKKRRDSAEKHDYGNADCLDGSPKQSVTQMLKDEIKSASDNVQERGKSVMESTRRLARNMMPKRFTSQQEYNGRDNPLMSGATGDRCQSLPSDDIFQSISFDSPLTPSPDVKPSFEESDCASDVNEAGDSVVEYFPPPLYPPPPPPDETLYDEVSSVKSSHSGSHQDRCPSDVDSYQDIDGIYEELSNARSEALKLDGDQDPQCSGLSTFHCSDSETASLPLPHKITKTCHRSDSWTFYDTVSCSRSDSSQGESHSNIYNEDPVALACSSRKAACSSSPSLCSELEALAVNTDDVGSIESGSQSSPGGSIGTSVSSGGNPCVSNNSSDNISSIQVEMRKKIAVSGHKLPSKSVIFEFDPLYENLPTAEELAGSNLTENDLMILAGLAPAKESKTSNYGRVNVKQRGDGNIVTVLEEETPSVEPPTPPARFDSIAADSTEISEVKSGGERAIDVPAEYAPVSLSRKSSMSQADADTNTSRFSLLRQHWPSMKKVIKSAYLRDSKVLPSEVSRLHSNNVHLTLLSIIVILLHIIFSGHFQTDSVSGKAPQPAFNGTTPPTPQLTRPALEPTLAVQYSGHVHRGTSGSKDMTLRWCHLAENQLVCTSDKSSAGNKETIPLDLILSLQLSPEHRVGYVLTLAEISFLFIILHDTFYILPNVSLIIRPEGADLHCFEVSVSGKSRPQVFGLSASMERRVWMQKILENFTTAFPTRIASGYTRFGWCFFKVSTFCFSGLINT